MRDLTLPAADNGIPTDQKCSVLQQELEAVQAQNRSLLRQLKKAQEAAAEATRAHAKMVATITETMRENAALEIERDAWKNRAQRTIQELEEQPEYISKMLGIENITEAEARAIRKAMARLHHPDSGGNPERMKKWNAVLDKIEHS